jgi:hypothetical protein
MGRIRTIKPEFPQSETVGRLSRDARLLFIQLWTIVDDEGRARAASRMLASLLYPYDDDARGMIDGWLGELELEGCIVRYEVDGSRYLEIQHWQKHQKVDHASASKLPSSREGSRVVAKDSLSLAPDLGPRTKDLGPERDADASLVDAGASPIAEQPDLPIKLDARRDELAKQRAEMQRLAEEWNDLACRLRLPQIEEIRPGSPRERAALARIRDRTDFDRIFEKIRGSPFLRGDRGRSPATFDWITNPTNALKILEGNYDEDRQARR